MELNEPGMKHNKCQKKIRKNNKKENSYSIESTFGVVG